MSIYHNRYKINNFVYNFECKMFLCQIYLYLIVIKIHYVCVCVFKKSLKLELLNQIFLQGVGIRVRVFVVKGYYYVIKNI